MNLIYKIVKNDIKLIFRDKSLMIIFIVPVAILLICRFAIALLPEIIPEIENYYWLIVTCFAMINAVFPSYLFSFILLDERDENVDLVFRILPVTEDFILKSRIWITIILGFAFSLLILTFNSLIHLSFIKIILLSLLFSLIPPVSTLAIAAFSKNKIEAATLFKGMNLLLFIPAIAFFIDDSLRYVFGLIPFFWIFETVRLSVLGSQIVISLLLALVTNSSLAWLLYKIYKKRIF